MSTRTDNMDRDAEIVRVRAAGEASLAELAERYGISVERVRQVSQRGGVDSRDASQAYFSRRRQGQLDRASEHETAILMRWIGGEMPNDIANSLGLSVKATQAVLDERITDEITSARRNNQTIRRFPEAGSGPRDDREPRDDRYWTYEKCMEALYYLAVSEGGRLPNTPRYKQLANNNEELPSFATVRNRIDRWSKVRLLVNQMLNQA